MKDFGGIQSPFDNAIVPVPTAGGGDGAKTGGVDIRDGKKGTGEIPIVTGVNVRDDKTDAMTAGRGIKGS